MKPLPWVAAERAGKPLNVDECIIRWANKLAGGLPYQGFVLEAIHVYHRPDWMVCRWKNPTTGEKKPLPMRWGLKGESSNLLRERPAKPVEGFTIYSAWNTWNNLAALASGWGTTGSRPTVMVVEGEWTADWLACLGIPAYTWPNGCGAVDSASFLSLSGFWVVLWPDNDRAGLAAMTKVRGILEALGCEVFTIDVEALDLPPKADAVDWIERFVAEHGAKEFYDIPDGVTLAVAAIEALPFMDEWKVAA